MDGEEAVSASVDEHLSRARACAQAGALEKAMAEVGLALKQGADRWEVIEQATDLLMDAERMDLAEGILKLHLRRFPSRAAAWGLLGGLANGRGAFEEALGHFGKATELDPRSAEYHDQLAMTLLALGRSGEALQYFKAQERSGELSPIGHHLIGVFDSHVRLSWERVARVGEIVRLAPVGGMGKATGQFFKSRIEDVKDGEVHVSYPTAADLRFPWSGRQQQVLVAWVWGEHYMGFLAVAVRRIRKPVPMLVLTRPNDVQQIQRRQSLRVPLPIVQRLEWKGEAVEGWRMVNLSIGGCCMKAGTWSPLLQDRVCFTLRLEPERMDVDGTIIRVSKVGGESLVAVRFDAMPERESERLARIVHQFQLEMRRKGLSGT